MAKAKQKAQDGWVLDVLGAGFEQLTMPLPPDDEGEVVATLVRHNPKADPQAIKTGYTGDPKFALLYVHGWNDYYFQRELARHVSAAGGAFYAVDLRKYGRSLRPHQSHGFMKDIRVYDQDLRAAFLQIRKEQGTQLPLLLMGHSTGGLTACLWAHRHPRMLAGLVLTSPWLEMRNSAPFRWAVTPVLAAFTKRDPKLQVMGAGHSMYGQSIDGWSPEMGQLPSYLEPWKDDPSVAGWKLVPQWKVREGVPLLAGFMNAVGRAQSRIYSGLDIQCPIFFTASTSSPKSLKEWSNDFFYQDIVLYADVLVERGAHLGNNITMRRIPTKHDPLLSFPPQRQEYWRAFHKWIAGEVLEDWSIYENLGEDGRQAICP